MKLIECEQGSEIWHQLRSGVCTASRFAEARSKLTRASKNGAAGDPSGDALSYAWSVAIERINGKTIDLQFATPAMRRGTELEPHARLAYELQTGLLASESGIAFTDCGAYAYSTDGLCGDDGLIEIKCPAAPAKLGAIWSNPEEADAEYIDQIQGGMWVTGRQWCDLVVYCPWLESVGKDLFIKRIQRDDAYIDSLATDLAGFSKLVDKYEAILRSPSKYTGL